MSALTPSIWRPSATLLVAIRVALLLTCTILATLVGAIPGDLYALALLSGVAVMSSLPVRSDLARRLQPVLAGILAASIVAVAATQPVPLLPYLLAPVISAGLVGGVVTAVTTAGLAAGAEFATTVITLPSAAVPDAIAASVPWMLLTVAVGLLASWVRRLELRPPVGPDPTYAAAYRLLSQLRLVSRQLSGGLDAVSLAQGTLQALTERLHPDRSACLVRPTDSGRMVTLAVWGEHALEWCAALEGGELIRDTWMSSGLTTVTQNRADGSALSAGFPLRMGTRVFGVIALAWNGPAPNHDMLREACTLVDESALRLGTALLFADIRTIATAEERRRVAREIHDGIAQELASLGYGLDELAARAPEPLRGDVALLRAELSRIVGELRLSIFDLRSGVEGAGGLGTAISDYVQNVGASSHLTVHLLLDERGGRLSLAVETELLRIVQEAVTNARKHADARNLWVTCSTDPPHAKIEVEDDGVGLSPGRRDSFGLMVMRERAERIGGRLYIEQRPEGGTRVVCELSEQRHSRPSGAQVPQLSNRSQ